MEYGFENTSFIETRARSLIGAIVDEKGSLVLLDDKGYLSVFDGANMLSNVFGQFSPSKFAVNTMAPGPEGTVIVTDAVGRVVSMIDPMTGDVSCSWRLPKVRVKSIGTVLGIGSVIFDIILVVIIIILVVRIRARIRRHQQYRSEDSR